MKTKIDIISGFLGSGKTTLIKKLLKEKLHSENIVIIENEFGEIETAIQEIVATYNPDRIIIEPSGVAKLSDIIKACNTIKLKHLIEINMVITLVDVICLI
ncbi:hypothetical protein KPL51_15090 [Clostridium bowmanii]|nr:hypothetical protein [Clostridium bowmanii]